MSWLLVWWMIHRGQKDLKKMPRFEKNRQIVCLLIMLTNTFCISPRCLKKYRKICYMFAVGMEGLCCLFIPLLRTFVSLVPFSVLYGYFDGAYVALIPVVTSDVVGTTYLSSALGVVFFLHAIPYLVSPPIGGKCLKWFDFGQFKVLL